MDENNEAGRYYNYTPIKDLHYVVFETWFQEGYFLAIAVQ